jgi:hypothetical protein
MRRILIIGTGFTAAVIYKSLIKRNVVVQCIQPNIANEPIVTFDITPGSIFDEELFNKNSQVGGGISKWGHAITFPSAQNFFLQSDNIEWREIERKVCEIEFEKVFGIQPTNIFTANTLDHILPNYESILNVEQHSYSGGKYGNKDPKTFIEPIEEYSSGRIISIMYNDEKKLYTIELLGDQGNKSFIECETLVFAAGAILNACLTSMLTGNSIFPIGNHFSRRLAEINFMEPLNLRHIAQTYAENDMHFLTFVLKNNVLQKSISNSSIRFQIESSNKKEVYMMIKGISSFHSATRVCNFILKSILIFLRSGGRETQSAILRMMVDQPLNEINHLEITQKLDGFFNCKITLQMDELTVKRAINLQNEFLDILIKSKLVKSVNILSENSAIPTPESSYYAVSDWNDTAHYFGSVPMINQSKTNYVDQEFQLNGFQGLHVIGNSSFPIGSHGHPTFLNMCLGYILGEVIT